LSSISLCKIAKHIINKIPIFQPQPRTKRAVSKSTKYSKLVIYINNKTKKQNKKSRLAAVNKEEKLDKSLGITCEPCRQDPAEPLKNSPSLRTASSFA